MKTIVVLSDTHGNKESVNRLWEVFKECDYIVHLGDGALDMSAALVEFPKKTHVCKGNCDFVRIPREGELEVENVKIFFCHGDRYGVKSRLDRLASEAKARGATLALFGHTHRAEITTQEGVTLVNPGSMRFPPHLGGTYAYITVKDGRATPVIVGDYR